ncbi:phosphatase PAP2 family protein [Halorhodospira halochloris]|uniref:Phosphoesterase n=1 Tax=Halorhodospira halochloris TaxID=1052 RepID=A0A120MZB7_HALHR|nr:phosphatase PAP2 family protein [Halorhodospira halochloris]MBK1650721.1 hypothetical protein [Halorhodospira halochloris]MCG5530925.1 phosphatase PAP2 family protein [Halorhodospira halochloris]MCG5549144.1 phosphatase PAP2 family protein [Halorhodospira halochloris]BAU56786.1 phosphoesterase [Halorhodospira halochloris]
MHCEDTNSLTKFAIVAALLIFPLSAPSAEPQEASYSLHYSDSLAQESGQRSGQETRHADNQSYLRNFYRVPWHGLRELGRTDSEGLTRNALAVGAIATAFTLDEEIRDWVQDDVRGSSSDKATDYIYEVGRPAVAATAFVLGYGYSFAASDQYLRKSLHLSFQALAITSAITETTRNLAGRERPRNSPDDAYSFGVSGGDSFFSGHASGTWAVMTVLAERYDDNPFIYWGAYSVAASTALSRVHDDGHWTSDIVIGSLVGFGIGRITVDLNPFADDNAHLVPWISESGHGAMLHLEF